MTSSVSFSVPTRIDERSIGHIRTPELVAYVRIYQAIEENLVGQIRAMGVQVDKKQQSPAAAFVRDKATTYAVAVENNGHSMHVGGLSPACATCRRGERSTTFLFDTACNRRCFFCFNPNQAHFQSGQGKVNDLAAALHVRAERGDDLRDIALTGGEPLLHRNEAVEFFRLARQLFPHSFLRLYTNGDYADQALLTALARAGLDEIRFSVKQESDTGYMEDPVLERISMARRVIPRVMVEMPVMPGDEAAMKDLLRALDGRGCDGVNLLELCFPLHNWEAYKQRGLKVKNPPFLVPYSYEYAGGLPVAGSEETCLHLLAFAVREKLSLGVHYCSLENKFTSQINLQNRPYANALPLCRLSERDFFLKSCKLFGVDARRGAACAKSVDKSGFTWSLAGDVLTLHPEVAVTVAAELPDAELAISYQVAERAENGVALRELCLDVVSARAYDVDSCI